MGEWIKMTEKRYFKREWEEEYYIFDSKTISEKEFDEKAEYEDYQAFVDSMQGDEVVDRLNALHEENIKLKSENEMLRTTISRNEAYIDRLTHQSEWSNHSQKVSVEDIIGLVKTDEPTDSVELKKELYK